MGSEISKKDITRLGFRSSLLQASFNYERMQAGGFTWAMLPILKKIYKDDKPGLSAAMKDNLEFINTHPNLGSDSNLLIVFYVQIMPDDLVMQLHR
ncbi:PTS system mannose/fructose/sorbose family transporter subunit IID, partial [Escherichia coli]